VLTFNSKNDPGRGQKNGDYRFGLFTAQTLSVTLQGNDTRHVLEKREYQRCGQKSQKGYTKEHLTEHATKPSTHLSR